MAAKPDTDDKAKQLTTHWQRMQSDMAPWRPQWQEIAELMVPRNAGIAVKTSTPSTSKESLLFDTTAGDALMTMAGGLMSWTMPSASPWFGFTAPMQLAKSDKVKAWAQECGEAMRYLLANSSFYSEVHEDLLNHCSFGTSCMYFGLEDNQLRFECLPTGSYCIEENRFGMVDTLFREFERTADQARDQFGEENLPPKVLECLKDPAKHKTRFKFLHAVYPRPDHEKPGGVGQLAAHGKSFASCYVELGEKKLVKESGYDYFPFSAGRYLKWTALEGKTAYGYGPGFAALPDTRQINFQQMMMDCLSEKIVRPPMVVDSRMEGDFIQTAGGVNYMDQGYMEPKPLLVAGDGNYNVGQDRVKMRADSIRAKFHAQLFNMFAELEGIRTATEIRERAAEKIDAITPAFTRLSQEKQVPMLQALFSLCLEAGLLPMPPPEAIQRVSPSMGVVPTPQIEFTSRLALAIKAQSGLATQRYVEQILQIAPVRPEVLAPVDWVKLSRGMARDAGVSTEYIKDEEQVQAEMAAQAKAAQMQQQMAMAEQGAKAAGHLGGLSAIKEAMSA